MLSLKLTRDMSKRSRAENKGNKGKETFKDCAVK